MAAAAEFQLPMNAEVAAGGVCSAMSNFISNALRTIFEKMRLGEPKRGALRVLVKIWNFVVTILETVVTTIVRKFEQSVLDKIAQVTAIVGTIASIISLVRPWTVSIKPEPSSREKGIAGIRDVESGALIAKYEVVDGVQEDWPDWAVDCARNSGRALPSLKAEGSKVTWSAINQSPPALVRETGNSSTLDAQGVARLDFTTLIDVVEDPYRTIPGTIAVKVNVEQRAIRNLADWAENEVWGMIPFQVGTALSGYLRPYLDRIKAKLTELLSKHSSARMPILYHVNEGECLLPGGPPNAVVDRPIGMVGPVAQGEDDCPTPPPPTDDPDPDPDPCEFGCPMSNGDPHIGTIDNSDYDFMAAGEFVLLRNGDSTFELQARQEPYGDSRTVSVNTALAMRVGSSRVAIYVADLESQNLDVLVDGAPADLSQPLDVGAGQVSRGQDGVEVRFPDGTRLVAVGQYVYGISVTVFPSDALRGSAVGVMGPVPSGGMGIPALPDGTVLPEVVSTADFHAQLYGTFEDAWRVTSATTLFDYEPGTTTDSYNLPDFPVEEDIQTMDDFTQEQLAAAAAACADLGNERLTLQCIFDVIVTGDMSFGEVYQQTATIVETGALPSTGALARVVNLYTENGQPVDLDVYAYTWSDATSSEAAALVATVPYGQASDWFNPGLVEAPSPQNPYTVIRMYRRGEQPDPFASLASVGEFPGRSRDGDDNVGLARGGTRGRLWSVGSDELRRASRVRHPAGATWSGSAYHAQSRPACVITG